jgi:hypothetical protein
VLESTTGLSVRDALWAPRLMVEAFAGELVCGIMVISLARPR